VRFFGSIRARFALSYALIISIILLLMNTYFLTASRDMIFASKQAFIKNQAAITETALRDFDGLTIDGVSQVMSRLDLAGLTRIMIMDASQKLLFYSANNYGGAPGGFSDSEIAYNITRTLQGNDVVATRFEGGAFHSGAFMPIAHNGTVIGSVFVHEYDTEQGSILLGLQSSIKNISIIVALVAAVIAALIIRTLSRQITGILRAIESVREGQYNYQITITGKDELSVMGEEFNSLTKRLHETEEIRRRFVADASHELKTPLASIRLLSDSILQTEDMAGDTIREFVTDIGNEADRLTRITEKLMSLTKLDNEISDEAGSVNVGDAIRGTLRILRPLAESFEITIDTKLADSCVITASAEAVHGVIFNLIENAIKYNIKGGSVSVRLKRDAGYITLTVDDTGIGVPESDLPYIFDRFYRVDKARSRSTGGSGLGLSIVRTALRDFGGSITAVRRESGGMRFEARFPLTKPEKQ
jgi:signal transduction histidine kinase